MPMAAMLARMPMKIMAMVSREKRSDGRAFHHHPGATTSIAANRRQQEWKSRWPSAMQLTWHYAPSWLEGVEFVDHDAGLAVIFGGRKDRKSTRMKSSH